MTANDGPEVLDASALLAWLQGEPGAESVRLQGAVMNSVNWSEVLQKSVQNGVDVRGIDAELIALGLVLRPFDLTEAARAPDLYPHTRRLGLSLGDRACLATAAAMNGVAVTADRRWREVTSVPVRLIK